MNQDKNTAPTSGWSTTPPTWKEGYYLWTRSKITYKNPTSTSYTTPICDSSWDAIKNIEIGGTNLVRKSDIKINNSTYTTGTFDDDSNTWTLTNTTGGTATYGLRIANKNVITPYGQTCIISFEIKTPREVKVNWDVNNYANSGSSWAGNNNDNSSLRKGSSKNIPANQWTKCWFSYTNTHSENTSKVDLYDNSNFGIVMTNETSNITYQIRNVKAELGTIPTAWSPCPLDIGYHIKTVSDTVATHTTELESITGRVSSVESTTSTLDGKVVGLDERVKSAEQKITKDGITNIVGDYYTTSTQFNNLSIGGRNLVKNSNFVNGTANWRAVGVSAMVSVDSSFEFNGHNTLKIAVTGQTSNKWSGLKSENITSVKSGDILTVSCWYYVEDKSTFDSSLTIEVKGERVEASSEGGIISAEVSASNIVQGKWTRLVGTAKLTSDYKYIYVYPWVKCNGTVWFADIKLEKGNKPTDWSPAPEDIDNSIVGGRNLLMNTQFKGAKPGTKTCPKWTVTSGCRVSKKQGTAGYDKENTIYIEPTSNNKPTGIEQYITSDIIPRNTTVTISGTVEAEANVLGAKVYIKFYNSSSTKIYTETTMSNSGGYGYFEYTFTTPDIDYVKLKCDIVHEGVTDTTAGSHLLIVSNLKLEKGNKATDWSPAPEDIESQFNSVTKSISEVKQTADSITSTVKSISKGGSNLLLNTRWEGAVPGESKCPEWVFNSGIHVYVKQGKTGYNKENTIYLGNSSTTAYLMYQRVPVSRIPRNTAMVVSCDINVESSVKGFQIGVDFYNNDTWVQGLNFFDETKYTKADNYNCKFTTPDLEYTHALFYIQHKGSNAEASGYLVIVGNLMLELGTKKTMWQPSYHELVNKSMVTQTASEIRYEFQQGGGFPNLVANGSPTQTKDNNW